ncbi:hypothetical protein [Geobacter anodireducens]|uniref:Uncharacterized protein n=1 Tax=Geobacter anodireducens TaxID=1340425 RepID=A0ABR9NY09_9BACT|nr:hypothetical protein [Geobacter anodireducens]MBE2889129.1 hypothetical protein [Geobacter anodireducens]
MALLVKKRIGNPSGALAEKMNLLASLQPQEDEDDMEFGFENDEEDYGEDEDPEDVEDAALNGPPPDAHDEVIPEKPAVAALPPKKPLRKPLVVMPESPAVGAPQSELATPQRPRKAAHKASSEKVQLGCKISCAHHRRLKIHSIVTGQSVLSILEEWIDQHCPPL